MKNCNDCRYHISGNSCGIIGMTTKPVKTFQGISYKSPFEQKITKMHQGEVLPIMIQSISLFGYNGLIAETNILNKDGQCKYYKRKHQWWKFWIKED